MRATGENMTGAELISRVVETLSAYGAREMTWTMGPDYEPSDAERQLLASGAQVDHAIDICGYLLDLQTPHFDIPKAITVVKVGRRTRRGRRLHAGGGCRTILGHRSSTRISPARSLPGSGPGAHDRRDDTRCHPCSCACGAHVLTDPPATGFYSLRRIAQPQAKGIKHGQILAIFIHYC